MSDFYPAGLKLNDTQTPMEILRVAQEDWNTNSSGLLALVLQEAKSQSGNDMIIVHAKHVPSNRSATLFSVVHRPSAPYPVNIQTKEDDLPNVLKKSYYKPGFTDVGVAMGGIRGHTIENKWVSDTPADFREKLKEVFNLGLVKSAILNLVSSSSGVADDSAREPPDIQAEED